MKVNFIARLPGAHTPIYETELDIIPRKGDFVQLSSRDSGYVHSVTFLVDPPTGESEVAVLLEMQGMN